MKKINLITEDAVRFENGKLYIIVDGKEMKLCKDKTKVLYDSMKEYYNDVANLTPKPPKRKRFACGNFRLG